MRLFVILWTLTVLGALGFGAETPITCKSKELCKGFFDKMAIAEQQVYDKSGKVRDEVFDTWSESQLREWYNAHDFGSSWDAAQAKGQNVLSSLRSEAKKHKDVLAEDLKWYQSEAAKSAAPYISKSKEYFSDTANMMFDKAVAGWSEARLQAFLAARGVAASLGSTREQLIDLAQRNKDKLQSEVSGNWLFDTWSRDDLVKKLKELGTKADGTREELVQRVSQAYESSKDYVSDKSDQAWNEVKRAANFDHWSVPDLQEYLQSYGIKTDGLGKTELAKKAKLNYQYFLKGTSKSPMEKLQDHASERGKEVWEWTKTCCYASYLQGKGAFLNFYAKLMGYAPMTDL